MTQNNFKVKHGLEVPSMDSVYLSDTTTPTLRPTLNLDFTKGFDSRITFTRASTATYYDGKSFATGDENLLRYSNDFTQSDWDKTNVSITDNSVIGPDGVTQNGSTLNEGALNAAHKISQTAGRTGVMTLSCYVKAGTRVWVRLTIGDDTDNVNAWFNLFAIDYDVSINGTAIFYTASMTDVGNGWYRCVLIGNPSTNVLTVKSATIAPADASGSISYQGTGNYLYIYGAQLESRDAVTPYVETTDTPVSVSFMRLVTAAANIPRIDYNPVTQECKGLLIEEARTNLCQYSSDFSHSFWGKEGGAVLIGSPTMAPNGSVTAQSYSQSTMYSFYRLQYIIGSTLATYTCSVYVKSGGLTQMSLRVGRAGPDTEGAIFDIVNGTILSTGTAITSASITPVGNGWFRVSVTNNCTIVGPQYMAIATGETSVTGDPTKKFYIWGAQIEQASFASSYIPTNGSQGTRSYDTTYIPFVSAFNPSEGTISTTFSTSVRSGQRFQTCYLGTSTIGSPHIFGNLSGNQTGGSIHSFSGTTIADSTTVIYPTTDTISTLYAYKSGDSAFAINGNLTSNSGTFTVSVNGTDAYIGCNNLNQYQLNGCIRKFQYYPKRLSNESIQSLSTR